MTPPINIDGTNKNYSNVTIDGQTVRQITIDGQDVLRTIPDSGVSRWTLDDAETGGGITTDVWGNNDGSINGATTGVTGLASYDSGEAFRFDGTDDYVSTPLNFGSVSQFSVAAWVNPDNVSDLQAIVGQTSFVDDGEGYTLALTGGNTRFQVSSGGNSFAIDNTASTGTIYHLVGTFDNGSLEFYVDGSSVGTNTNAPSSLDPAPDFNLGRRPISDDSYLAGDVDDPRVWDKPLTATEVSNLYNTGSISG